MSIKYLLRVMHIEHNLEVSVGQLTYLLELHYPEEFEKLKSVIDGIPLYTSSDTCLRSTLCIGAHHQQTCPCCQALSFEASVQQRILRGSSDTISKLTRHSLVKLHALVKRVQEKGSCCRGLFFEVSNTKQALGAALRKLEKYEAKLESALARGNGHKYFRNFIRAAEADIFPPQAMQEIVDDMGKSLVSHGQKRPEAVKGLYVMLLNCGSPWVASFVSQNLGGPNSRTIQRWRGGMMQPFTAGRMIQNLVQLVEILTLYNLLDVPWVWSEDATTCIKRLTASLDDNPDGIEIWVEGFNEPVLIKSVKELNDAFEKYKKDDLASYVYVWTWVPQLPHAPYFPVMRIASNNRFDHNFVWEWWMWLFSEGKRLGLKCIGSVADGDARLRRCEAELNKHNKLGCETRTLDHPLIYLHISILDGQPMLGYQDWMHCSGFRIRRQLLDGTHNFHLNDGAEAGVAHLRSFMDTIGGFTERDLDYHEKQHWSGCLKIFSLNTVKKLQDKMDADPVKDCRGTLAYVIFGLRLLGCSIGKEAGAEATDRKQAVVDAAFSCVFALYWRWQVTHNLKDLGHTLKKHFLTRETFLDVLNICQTRILVVILYREWYPKFKVHAPNLSSRFSEYVFQYCRMHQTNSPLFNIAGFRRHVKHLIGHMKLAATTGLKIPQAKRGVPHGVKYFEDRSAFEAPDGWHLTDE